MKLDKLMDKMSGELNEVKGPDARKVAKKLFIELMDPEVIEGGLENLHDIMDEVMVGSDPNTPESLALQKEVESVVKDYIRQTKAFIKTLK